MSSNGVVEEATLMVVGSVASDGADLGVLGSFDDKQSSLHRAKWHFVLERPRASCFAPDFERALFVLNLLQGLVSTTGVNRGVVAKTGESSTLAFAAPLFIKRVTSANGTNSCSLMPAPQGKKTCCDPNVAWPVPYGARKGFQEAQDNYVFRPMEVMSRVGVRLPPKDWARVLPGALVEVTFTLHHAVSPDTMGDDFGAWAKTVRVIKSASAAVGAQRQTPSADVGKEARGSRAGPLDVWLIGGKCQAEGVSFGTGD
ncbi:hypothetical protein BDN71DRAFT_1430866 [Pleurotus eryngii]|uniref:Uncharacterized protein n=1 Tax=Pleurotus eryngii TaxID=5323 RepID=A0A9P5ZX77_PLEER|nr:hypothetical protein BDN71DRAFT_1430866 [Pleurotus eryngii]